MVNKAGSITKVTLMICCVYLALKAYLGLAVEITFQSYSYET
jgi:hypothetical protein